MDKTRCEICNKEFSFYPSEEGIKKYCSRACACDSRRIKIEVTCLECGKQFIIPPRKYRNGKRKYCSRGCSHHSKERAEKISHSLETSTKKSCLVCGKIFKARPSSLEHGNAKYCSKHCFNESQRNSVILKCVVCGNEYKRWPSKILKENSSCCSNPCRHKHHTEQIRGNSYTLGYKHTDESKKKMGMGKRGDKHYNWKGGISPERKLIWGRCDYRNWRKSVFERDNYTCNECLSRGGYLHAHHIQSFANYPDLRFVTTNGMTLCAECHMNLHRLLRKAY